LTWPPETKNNGACSEPPNCKESPSRLVGSGEEAAPNGDVKRKVPKAEAMLPGTTGATKLAALTTPPALIDGADPPPC
jgi:hypothetical protein